MSNDGCKNAANLISSKPDIDTSIYLFHGYRYKKASSAAIGRACTPKCLPPSKRFVQAGVAARRRGLLLPG
jgi:hypothetical protein